MFVLKTKEPELSETMQAVLYRSMGGELPKGEYEEARVDDVLRIKYRIMNFLINNEDILRVLHHPHLSKEKPLNPGAFRNEAIFDYLVLPSQIKTEIKNYICFDVDLSAGSQTNHSILLTFNVISHDDDCRTEWGFTRHDLLAAILANALSWSSFGKTAIRLSDTSHCDDSYHYRTIIYRITSPNEYYNRV